ncbi:hypothetical protein TB2_006710 [Malus domestica]
MSDPARARSITGSELKTLIRLKLWDFRSCTSSFVDEPSALGLGLAGAEASGKVGAEKEEVSQRKACHHWICRSKPKWSCGDRSWWRHKYQSSGNLFTNLTDADYGRVELYVVETAKLGDSSNDVLGVFEVKLPCYVRENANPSAHPPSEASSGMAAIGLDVGLDPGLGLGRVLDLGKVVFSCLGLDQLPYKFKPNNRICPDCCTNGI